MIETVLPMQGSVGSIPGQGSSACQAVRQQKIKNIYIYKIKINTHTFCTDRAVILSPKGHLAMSGDVFGCHN